MPVKFQLNDTKYETPNGWGSVLFSRFLEYLNDIEPQRPAQLNNFLTEHYKAISKIGESVSEDKRNEIAIDLFTSRWQEMSSSDKFICYEFMCIDVGFWCNIEPSEIQEAMNLEQLEQTFWTLHFEMNPDNAKIDEKFTGFEIKGVEYLLPIKHMTESTVLEFAESAQFQTAMIGVQNGEYRAMADVMVVLCRPKGEPYKYSKIRHSNRKKLFLETTMHNVINTAFFLLRLNETLKNNLLIYTLDAERQNLEARISRNGTVGQV